MGWWELKWIVNYYAISMTYNLITVSWEKFTGSEYEIFMKLRLSIPLVASSEVASMSHLKTGQHGIWNNGYFYWTLYVKFNRRQWKTKVTIIPLSKLLKQYILLQLLAGVLVRGYLQRTEITWKQLYYWKSHFSLGEYSQKLKSWSSLQAA